MALAGAVEEDQNVKLSVKSERKMKSLCLLVVAWFLKTQAAHPEDNFYSNKNNNNKKQKVYLDCSHFYTLLLRGSSSIAIK